MSRLGEGLWSTKFVLPEQQAALEQREFEGKKKKRPTLDDQELEMIQQTLAEAYREHRRIKIMIYDDYKDKDLNGFVTAIQAYRREIKLTTAPDEWQWVQIENILAVN